MNGRLLEQNLALLSRFAPQLAHTLRETPDEGRVHMVESRKGLPVPMVRFPTGEKLLHSRFDPWREADRFASHAPENGFLVVFGLGAGYHLTRVLESGKVTGLFVVDTDLTLCRELFARVDYTALLKDGRITICLTEDPAEVSASLSRCYLPLLAGDLELLTLRSRTEADPDFFQHAAHAVERGAVSLHQDLSVQRRFGARWFSHTVLNSANSRYTRLTGAPAQAVSVKVRPVSVITAAGPTLDRALPVIAQRRNDVTLIATDTSLPALQAARIAPDVIVSIDCQHVTYLHFMNARKTDRSVTVADLASSPLIYRVNPRPVPFASSHPLSLFLAQEVPSLLRLDTSGGNVTQSAVALADALGSEEIHIYGADYAYANGRPYARGTYFFPYVRAREHKLQPSETLLTATLFSDRESHLEPEPGDPFRYATPLLARYRDSLNTFSGRLHASVVRHTDSGHQEISRGRAAGRTSDSTLNLPPAGALRAALEHYKDALETAEEVGLHPAAFRRELSAAQASRWLTLLPLAAFRAHRMPDAYPLSSSALETVRKEAVALIERTLRLTK